MTQFGGRSVLPRTGWAGRVLAGVLTAALAVLVTVAVAPGPAGASHHSNVRSAAAHTCPGFAAPIPTVAMWTDYHSEQTPLPQNIAKLICSVADGATIDIKSWFFKINDTFTRALVARLALMHRYHRVHVNVFVGRNASGVDWNAFRRAFSFASVAWCDAACKSPDPSGVSHSKWITVSRLRNGRPAVLSTSTNWSHQQFADVEQSGIFVSGNRALYNDFVGRWTIYHYCAEHRCDKRVGAWGWRQAGRFAVHFAPATNDAIADELSTVTCGRFGHVYVASLFFHRPEVMTQLVRLISTGCDVRVLLARPFTAYTARKLNPRHLIEHDKYVVVWSGWRREVMAGSEDLGLHEMSSDDNQMLRVRIDSVVLGYARLFVHQWAMSSTVSPAMRVAHVDIRETS